MSGINVLIIENEPDIAGFFKATLELDGFHCDLALSAREALLYLTTNIPELILLDLHLGGEINGQDILYQVRINPLFQNTRVVVATAHPQVANLVSHLADLVLLKPVDAQQLRTLAERITSQEFSPRRQAFLDPVTGLYNQAFFNLRLEHAFERSRRRTDFDDIFSDDDSFRRQREAVVRPLPTPVERTPVKVHLVEPKNFNDAQLIADKFKSDIPVILNLQRSDTELSKRLIDFASGLTYALEGGIERVADKVFLLTPRNVEVSAEEKQRLIEKGFFNQF